MRATRGRPITFLEGAAFQWVNPKGWVMAVGAISTYAAVAAFPGNVLLIAFLFGTLGVAVECDVARLRHEPAPVAQEPAHRARRQYHDGGAAGGLAVAYPRRRVAVSP